MKGRKRYIVIALVALLLMAGTTALVLTMNQTAASPAQMLSLGERFLLELDFEQALVQFLGVIEIEPNNVQAHLGAAAAYVGLGQIENAAGILRQGLERTGDEEIAWAWVELEPDVSGVYLLIAEILISFNHTPLAILILQFGLERTGSDEIREMLRELGVEVPDIEEVPETAEAENVSETAGAAVDPETEEQGNVNLTGQPPLSFAEIEEWGWRHGATADEMIGTFGITSGDIDSVLQRFPLNPEGVLLTLRSSYYHVFVDADLVLRLIVAMTDLSETNLPEIVPSKSKHQTLNNKRLNHTRIKQGFEQEKPV